MNKNIYKAYRRGQLGCAIIIIIFGLSIIYNIIKYGIN